VKVGTVDAMRFGDGVNEFCGTNVGFGVGHGGNVSASVGFWVVRLSGGLVTSTVGEMVLPIPLHASFSLWRNSLYCSVWFWKLQDSNTLARTSWHVLVQPEPARSLPVMSA
jgi:hypothetical protein